MTEWHTGERMNGRTFPNIPSTHRRTQHTAHTFNIIFFINTLHSSGIEALELNQNIFEFNIIIWKHTYITYPISIIHGPIQSKWYSVFSIQPVFNWYEFILISNDSVSSQYLVPGQEMVNVSIVGLIHLKM